jgi:septal ring factor EnvC (AmiA/AmiB activator)
MAQYQKVDYLSRYGKITGYGSPLWKAGLDVDLKKGDTVSSPKNGKVVFAGKNGG